MEKKVLSDRVSIQIGWKCDFSLNNNFYMQQSEKIAV